MIAPYLMGAGAAIGGPIGAAVGGILAGAIGYGGAGFMGSELAEWLVGSELGDVLSDLLGGLLTQAAGTTAPRIDPIVLDLDGDGIETLSQENGTYFDLDNNRFAERSGWIQGDDGLLVLDRDGNGQINGGRELFGDQTILLNGSVASNGFQALSELDDNRDGKIDINDSKFVDLRVWRDINQDGQSSDIELFGLEQQGIKSLSLTNNSVNTQDPNGNTISRVGSYEKVDGSAGNMSEYLLARNTADTMTQEWLDIPESMASLPDITGMGSVYSLKQAMVRDTSGELQLLIEGFANETNISNRNAMIDAILFKWTDSSNIDPLSRGGNFDARKLAVLEKFNGRSYTGTSGSNPIAQAVPLLTQAYDELNEKVYSKLLYQTHLSNVFENVNYNWDYTSNKIKVNSTEIRNIIEQKINENSTEGVMLLGELSRVLKGSEMLDSVEFANFRKYFADKSEDYAAAIDLAGIAAIVGGAANDNLSGTANNDAIGGGDGDDTLNGNDGDDLIYGQNGNDTIYGGDGNDGVYGGTGNDAVNGGTGNNVLTGGEGDDTIYGELGNDVLDGGAGNDNLKGGSTSSENYNTAGNDTYIFGRGYGVDTITDVDTTVGNLDVISMKEDVLPGDVTVKRNSNDLELSINGTTDKLIVKNYFSSTYTIGPYSSNTDSTNMVNKVEQIQFADGTIWDVAYINNAASTITGTENADTIYGFSDQDDVMVGLGGNDMIYGYTGNDTLSGGDGDDSLYGGNGNDSLTGGIGNDYLEGGFGNDTYVFNTGNGQDSIFENDTTSGNKDTVIFSEEQSNLIFTHEDNNLKISMNGTTDTLTINSWYSGSTNQVEEFKTSDGSTLTNIQVDQLIQTMASFTQQNGMSWDQAIQDRPQDVQNIVSQFWVQPSA